MPKLCIKEKKWRNKWTLITTSYSVSFICHGHCVGVVWQTPAYSVLFLIISSLQICYLLSFRATQEVSCGNLMQCHPYDAAQQWNDQLVWLAVAQRQLGSGKEASWCAGLTLTSAETWYETMHSSGIFPVPHWEDCSTISVFSCCWGLATEFSWQPHHKPFLSATSTPPFYC